MSRVAKKPIEVPGGVQVTLNAQNVTVKGANGELSQEIHESVKVEQVENKLTFAANDESPKAWAQAGTARALVNNMVIGVSKGFEKKLELVGVGYRAKAKGGSVELTLGFSHPVVYNAAQGVTIETPSQTEILVKGADKQAVGQAASDIRDFRPPEPYKGKGVKYANEYIRRKEAKKK